LTYSAHRAGVERAAEEARSQVSAAAGDKKALSPRGKGRQELRADLRPFQILIIANKEPPYFAINEE